MEHSQAGRNVEKRTLTCTHFCFLRAQRTYNFWIHPFLDCWLRHRWLGSRILAWRQPTHGTLWGIISTWFRKARVLLVLMILILLHADFLPFIIGEGNVLINRNHSSVTQEPISNECRMTLTMRTTESQDKGNNEHYKTLELWDKGNTKLQEQRNCK
jgi:hypothetical protein